MTDLILEHSSSSRGKPLILGNLNLHALYVREVDRDMRQFAEISDLTLIDGAPILVLAEAARRRRISPSNRIGSTDWLEELMRRQQAITVTAIGGTARTASAASSWAKATNPAVTWHAFDGYGPHITRPSARLQEAIAASDLVLVALGMPKQEKWILEHLGLLDGCVVANVGGCLDYFAGEQDLAPRWMGAVGIEWAFRLVKSPRRLAGRYLIEPFRLVGLVVRRLIRERNATDG
ncbi:WecB/TagA/CpsF family glycosyltransferase [Microbacterium sp. NPDC089190]|uniref:WecB/TagA/CpsF family glycosyltransferase n=1 Tax=Microbacterium sp. NPDC089190 TaxID=3155063 RepID=UPI00344CEACC